MSNSRPTNHYGLYHTFNRGVRKESIFYYDADKNKFLDIIKNTVSGNDIDFFAYCIMDNHYHLFINDKKKNLSDYFRDIQSCYAGYYNTKYGKEGHVFEGPFKSKPINGYMVSTRVLRYIFRNPVKANIVQNPYKYEWSSIGESNKVYNISDRRQIEIIFENANTDMDEYIFNDSDDKRISILEKEKMSMNMAKRAFFKILVENDISGIDIFADLSKKSKIEVLALARYHGITIKQLEEITKLPHYFIKFASPDYIGYI